jgi:hypothetical protein
VIDAGLGPQSDTLTKLDRGRELTLLDHQVNLASAHAGAVLNLLDS